MVTTEEWLKAVDTLAEHIQVFTELAIIHNVARVSPRCGMLGLESIAEFAINTAFMIKYDPSIQEPTFHQSIEQLFRKGILNEQQVAVLHTLRKYANECRHQFADLSFDEVIELSIKVFEVCGSFPKKYYIQCPVCLKDCFHSPRDKFINDLYTRYKCPDELCTGYLDICSVEAFDRIRYSGPE